MSSLLEQYELTEKDCKQVSVKHLEEICHSFRKHWRSLPTHLEMQSFVWDSHHEGKEEMKHFFLAWKQIKGSGATYTKLISAFSQIGSTIDAESVCKLLTSSLSPPRSRSTKTLRKVDIGKYMVAVSLF